MSRYRLYGEEAIVRVDLIRTLREAGLGLERFERHDPRASRYWELVAAINGQPAKVGRVEDWRWIAEAAKLHLR